MNNNPEKKQKIVQLPMFGDVTDGETPPQLPKYTQQVKFWVELAQKTNDPAGYIAGILERSGIYPKSIQVSAQMDGIIMESPGSSGSPGSSEYRGSDGSDESQGTSIRENENAGRTETESRVPRQLIFDDKGMPYYRSTRRITVNHKAAYGGNLEQFKRAYELFEEGIKTQEIIRQINARPASVYRWVKRFRECGSGR